MELLAPAGDIHCLEAAIAAGADAVYLGLSLMNARRGAKNFSPAELEAATRLAQKNDVRTHLTLNIDIAKREIGTAARILCLARDLGIDAVIARDWAIVGLWQALQNESAAQNRHCPELHLSTQTAVTNPEGARLARDIGASRIVLARELSLAEIKEIGQAAPHLEIEVFAQGALCYSISGRCLLSSWGGGRSGNRGLCASPCRVPWAVDGEAVGTAMSMRDLVTVDRLGELAAAGVDSIKIEGRLKKPEWVHEAVSLYRTALGPRKGAERFERPDNDTVIRARRLAEYAGRDTTSAYLDGSFRGLTGRAARKSSRAAEDAIDDFLSGDDGRPLSRHSIPVSREPENEGYSLEINVTDKGLSCRLRYQGRSESWRMPKTRIKREKKAVSVDELFSQLQSNPFGDARLGESYSNESDFMLPPRNVKAIVSTIGSFINRLTGKSDGVDSVMKLALPDIMRAAVATPPPDPANCRLLGEKPNQVRVSVKQLNSSLLPLLRGIDLVVQNATAKDMDFILKFVDPPEFVVSFPDVYFPSESRDAIELAELCRAKNIRVEANCWGSVWLCRELGLDYTTGPGMPILNHLAVKCLRDLDAKGATISMEADRQQIEDVCSAAALPMSLLIYARPVLAYTRIPAEALIPDASSDGAWTDRRGISLKPEEASRVTVFRSLSAFNWKTLQNNRIKVANLVMDLSGESFPVDVWKTFNRPGGKAGFLFNYDRGLK